MEDKAHGTAAGSSLEREAPRITAKRAASQAADFHSSYSLRRANLAGGLSPGCTGEADLEINCGRRA